MDDGTHGYRVGCLQEQVRQLQETYSSFLYNYSSRDIQKSELDMFQLKLVDQNHWNEAAEQSLVDKSILINIGYQEEIEHNFTSKVFFYFYALNGLTTHFEWLIKFECKKLFLKKDRDKKKSSLSCKQTLIFIIVYKYREIWNDSFLDKMNLGKLDILIESFNE